jgi:hypothetical protein
MLLKERMTISVVSGIVMGGCMRLTLNESESWYYTLPTANSRDEDAGSGCCGLM